MVPCSLQCSANRYKNNASYYDGDNQGPGDRNKRKRKGAANSIVEAPDTTLGISQKQRRILAMVMC